MTAAKLMPVAVLSALFLLSSLGNATDRHHLAEVSNWRPNPRPTTTCDNYPRICRAPGSPGPDCCNRRCVDVDTNSLNCGRCGGRCGYGQDCCHGSCVSVLRDTRNCGSCGNRCNKRSKCVYGMCSYA